MTTNKHPQLIRRPKVIQLTGLSKRSLYNRINDGLFPSPISLGLRAVAFVASEVDTVIQAMIEEQPPAEIKVLVSNLIQQRKQFR
jgi:prophage regulatory protein